MLPKSLLFLLRRCVALRPAPLPAAVTVRPASSSAISAWSGFIQPPTSTPRAVRQLQPALRVRQCGFCTKPESPCEDEYPPLPAYQCDPEAEKREVYIIKVKGLPWSCTTQDLVQFFSECRIRGGVKGIHLTVDRQGRPSGRGFIEMEHEEDVSKALEKHRQYLGPRYVEVSEVTDSDAESILKKVVRPPPEDGVVRVRGLPFASTPADIMHFFSGLEIVENGITMVTDRMGRNSGEAFVQFSSQEAAEEALQRHRELIGSRYIEVFPSSSEQISSSWRKTSSAPGPQSTQQPNRTTSVPQSRRASTLPCHYIHLRGLPFQVSGEDILKFFSPLVVSKIVLECSPQGKLSGEADVFFSSHQDALTAMSRDRMCIGERYIELFLNSEPDSH